MAKSKEDTQADNGEVKKAKKSTGKLVTLLLIVLLVLGGGGVAAYKFVLNKPEAAETAEESSAKGPETDLEKLIGTMVRLDTFLVNIEGEGETRFLKTSLTLELERADVQREIELRMDQIRDNILVLLSSKNFAEIRSFDGKYILREEIEDQLNNLLVTGAVKNIYFTEFVVQ